MKDCKCCECRCPNGEDRDGYARSVVRLEIYDLKEQIKKLNRSIELREACIDVYKNIVNNLYKLLDIDIKEREEESLVDKEIKK